jgi:hypothetical protein
MSVVVRLFFKSLRVGERDSGLLQLVIGLMGWLQQVDRCSIRPPKKIPSDFPADAAACSSFESPCHRLAVGPGSFANRQTIALQTLRLQASRVPRCGTTRAASAPELPSHRLHTRLVEHHYPRGICLDSQGICLDSQGICLDSQVL